MFRTFQQIIVNKKALSFYYSDQNGIMRRYLAEGINWNSHLTNVQNYITTCVKKYKPKSVAVLGSGWLLDVPMQVLAAETERLALFDIKHPRQVVNRFRKMEHVDFVQMDLTNNLIELVKKAKNFNDFLNELDRTKPLEIFKPFDLVISVNLLNQLDILLCDLIERKFSVSQDILQPVREKIQQLHMESLPGGKSCVITDFEEMNYINTFDTAKISKLVFVPLNRLEETREWLWVFDTHKTYRKKYKTTFKVIAGILE